MKFLGKHYAISDIHGMYGSYIEIMKRMTSKDHLIILGDVIDRGTGGIQIIQDIMQRKQNKQNNPEITFMLGNHEMQFLETVATMIRRGLKKEDLITIMNRRIARAQYGYYSLHSDPKSRRNQEEWKKKLDLYDVDYQKLITEKGLTDWELDIAGIWLISNKGDTTIFDFLQGGRVNGAKEQQAIYSFLCDSYVALPQNINGEDYLFVHAMPPKDPQMISQMKQSKKGYKFKELTRDQYTFMLEERDKSTYEQAKAHGFTTICGHTPEYGEIIIDDNRGFIRIDAGCGHKQKKSKLALYCIDDGKVEYFDEKGLKKGKTVVLFPNANTIEDLPWHCWEHFARRVRELGFTVCTNVEPDGDIISGTCDVFVPYPHLKSFVESLENGVGYIDNTDAFEYKVEDGINGEKVGKYIDNEYDFIKKVCKELLKRMEDE